MFGIVLIADQQAVLPMDRYEAEQFLYDLGLDQPGAQYEMELVNSNYFLIDLDSNFRELNRLAHRVEQLTDYGRETLSAWYKAQHFRTVNDVMLASYNLDKIEFHPGFYCDEMLGEFALDNEIFEEYSGLPDEVYAALDRVQAGARMREQDGGVFTAGGYLITAPFNPLAIPQEEPLQPFEIHAIEGTGAATYSTSWPQLAELPVTVNADEIQELYALGQTLAGISRRGDRQAAKCKALFEAMLPGTIGEARCLAENLAGYAVNLEHGDPAEYGCRVLRDEYNLQPDDLPVRFVDLAGLGKAAAQAAGYELTRYGAVKLEPIPVLASEHIHVSLDFQCEATGGWPTVLCVDWEEEYAWLELAPGYDDGSEEAEACHEACRVWGLRGCPDWQEYNALAQWLGEEAYQTAAVEIGEQAMGGMGGME